MQQNDFLKKMENLKKPEVSADASRRQIKLAMMSAKKSATWGIWFLIVPVLFLTCITIKELFQWNWGFAEHFTDWIGKLDSRASTKWLTPVLFVLLSAIGAVTNLLAIM